MTSRKRLASAVPVPPSASFSPETAITGQSQNNPVRGSADYPLRATICQMLRHWLAEGTCAAAKRSRRARSRMPVCFINGAWKHAPAACRVARLLLACECKRSAGRPSTP
eukprot:s3962_g13.t1